MREAIHCVAKPVHATGVTLIELLVGLVIVAILSAIAWPGYSAVIQKAQRHEARLALMHLQHLQERHYASHLRYAHRLGAGTDVNTLAALPLGQTGLYELSLHELADGQGFTAHAKARLGGPQGRDRDCRHMSIDHTGRRRSADSSGTWTELDPHGCWS